MAAEVRILGIMLAGAALAAQPLGIGPHRLPALQAVLAHGGGGGAGAGGSGGAGAGGGGGGGGGNGSGAGHAADGHADGHASDGVSGDGPAEAAHTSPAMRGNLSAAMAALNAAHAAPAALAHASPHSVVGKLAAYRSAMLAALAMPTNTPQEEMAQDTAIAHVRANMLAPTTNKSLTPSVVANVDSLLGLPPSDPALGVTR